MVAVLVFFARSCMCTWRNCYCKQMNKKICHNFKTLSFMFFASLVSLWNAKYSDKSMRVTIGQNFQSWRDYRYRPPLKSKKILSFILFTYLFFSHFVDLEILGLFQSPCQMEIRIHRWSLPSRRMWPQTFTGGRKHAHDLAGGKITVSIETCLWIRNTFQGLYIRVDFIQGACTQSLDSHVQGVKYSPSPPMTLIYDHSITPRKLC